ncbi:hypothetical protein IMZ48_41300 [Candidatus Bathyarchaeota archaeon]|nr:hypothetical protein [Candidatus Bathyarchaeota archaeon]
MRLVPSSSTRSARKRAAARPRVLASSAAVLFSEEMAQISSPAEMHSSRKASQAASAPRSWSASLEVLVADRACPF